MIFLPSGEKSGPGFIPGSCNLPESSLLLEETLCPVVKLPPSHGSCQPVRRLDALQQLRPESFTKPIDALRRGSFCRSVPVQINEKVPHNSGHVLKRGKGLGPIAECSTNLGLQQVKNKIFACRFGTRFGNCAINRLEGVSIAVEVAEVKPGQVILVSDGIVFKFNCLHIILIGIINPAS